MDRWIARQNIARFKQQLQNARSEAERRAVEKMLADEEAKLRTLEHDDSEDKRS